MGKFPNNKKFSRDNSQRSFGGGNDRRRPDAGGGQGRGARFAPRHDEDRPMFQAVCTMCHKDCEVPFRPSGDKPVFCRDCFRKERDGADSSFQGGDRRDERAESFRRMDTQRPQADTSGADQYKTRFEQLNNKLDKILQMLTSMELKDLEQTVSSVPTVPVREAQKSSAPRPPKMAKKVVDTKALNKVVAHAVAKADTGKGGATKKPTAAKKTVKVANKTTAPKKVAAKKKK